MLLAPLGLALLFTLLCFWRCFSGPVFTKTFLILFLCSFADLLVHVDSAGGEFTATHSTRDELGVLIEICNFGESDVFVMVTVILRVFLVMAAVVTMFLV